MLNGVLNIYKEPGFTSFDVVAKLRGILGQKKIGHMGTLDPDAVGVLPVCLGKATKLCDMLSEKDKEYVARIRFGVMTDTQDSSGKVTAMAIPQKLESLSEDKVREVIESFIGDYDQIPPMFSAIKIGGKKLYKLAREGVEIERPPRHCKIYNIDILDMNLPFVNIKVSCSKGTYIRTLCHDIGLILGVGACMDSLKRTAVDRFSIEDSIDLATVERLYQIGELESFIIPTDDMLDMYSKCMVSSSAERLVKNGNLFTSSQTRFKMNHDDGQIVRVYLGDDTFIGLYKFDSEKQIYKPEKMFL